MREQAVVKWPLRATINTPSISISSGRKQRKEAEMRQLRVIEEGSLEMLQTEIGRGCFGVCFLARYGAPTVVVKQQENSTASKHEAR